MINVKNLVLGVGIIIVFALVLWQGIEAFYPSPQWDDFCEERNFPRPAIDEEPEKIPEIKDDFETCQKEYDLARDSHAKITFIVSLIVAIAALLIGHTILSIEPVGSALMGSGIWAIFWGSVVNWRNFSSIGRFLLLLMALILLIYLAIKSNQKKNSFFGFLKK
jgi:hypothetical protein